MKQQSDIFIEEAGLPWEDVGGGVKRKIMGYDQRIMLVKVAFEKGAIGTVHRHPHSQTAYVEKGAFEVTIGGEKKVLRTGDCFYIPPETDHGVIALEDGILMDVFSPSREDFLNQ